MLITKGSCNRLKVRMYVCVCIVCVSGDFNSLAANDSSRVKFCNDVFFSHVLKTSCFYNTSCEVQGIVRSYIHWNIFQGFCVEYSL